jgi:hypothetical protein
MLSFEQFIASGFRNQWISEPGIDMYVRIALPFYSRYVESTVDYDLANLVAVNPGNGALTRFLNRYEPLYGFRVESILNPRLIPYLERRGYILIPPKGPSPSMVRGRPI